MLVLRHPVAASALLAGAYGGLQIGKKKIEKQRPGKLFLIFFVFKEISATSLGALCRISSGLDSQIPEKGHLWRYPEISG